VTTLLAKQYTAVEEEEKKRKSGARLPLTHSLTTLSVIERRSLLSEYSGTPAKTQMEQRSLELGT